MDVSWLGIRVKQKRWVLLIYIIDKSDKWKRQIKRWLIFYYSISLDSRLYDESTIDDTWQNTNKFF
jgi:hypothetical protein